MKKIFLLLLLNILTIGTASATAARTTSTFSPSTSTASSSPAATSSATADQALAAYKSANTANKLAKLQTLGDKLIDQRIATLNGYINKDLTGLSAAQSTELRQIAQTDINTLTTLKSQIDAGTDLATTKTNVLSIYDNYHIYLVRMPQLHLSAAVDRAQNTYALLNAMTVRLQNTIATQKAAGTDTTALSATLVDYQKQVADANTNLNLAKTDLAKIDIKSTSTSATAIAAVTADLKAFRADAVAALGDIKAFKAVINPVAATSPTKTPTPTVTHTSTPTPTVTHTPTATPILNGR
ncbi:MAG: hypothetical protein WC773_01875 [Patescibacteria group bacterium]|jgi:hypothetical protein